MSTGGPSNGGIVIVGAGLGGVRTAERLREGGYDGRLTLLGAEPDPPYDRPPLSKQVLRGERPTVYLRPPESYAELGVELRLGATARALEAGARCIELADGATLRYDQLVIATGARPRLLRNLPSHSGVHVLRTLRDCERLRDAAGRARSAIVVGGGFIGCEVAASLRMLGLDVTLVELAPGPLAPVLGERVAGYVTELHRGSGVRVLGSTAVGEVAADGDGLAVRLDRGEALTADLVVVGLGVTPEVEWLAGSGVECAMPAEGGGVRCDAYGATSVDGVFAVGDVASYRHPVTGRHRRFEHWTSAVEQAAVVARNLVSDPGERVAHDAVPYFWSDQYKVKIQSLGVPSPAADVTVVELTETKRVALYAEDGILTGVVGFSSASAVMSLRVSLATPTAVEEAVQQMESRRTVSA